MIMTFVLSRFSYNWPLLEIVGFTSTMKNFNIAFVLMMRETTEQYAWALDNLKHLLQGVVPNAIVSDRELGLIGAINKHFPDSHHLLCKVHVLRDIEAYASKRSRSDSTGTEFHNDCVALFASKSERSFEMRLRNMRRKWDSRWQLMEYLETT